MAAVARNSSASGRGRKAGNSTRKPAATPIPAIPTEDTSKAKVKPLKPSGIAKYWNWIDTRRMYIPLILAVSLQSFTVGLWTYYEYIRIADNIGFIVIIFSIMAGLSLESVMVGTVLSITEKTKWTTYITLGLAWLGSTWIGLAQFNTGPFWADGGIAWDLKHAIWPTIIGAFLIDMANKKNEKS